MADLHDNVVSESLILANAHLLLWDQVLSGAFTPNYSHNAETLEAILLSDQRCCTGRNGVKVWFVFRSNDDIGCAVGAP